MYRSTLCSYFHIILLNIMQILNIFINNKKKLIQSELLSFEILQTLHKIIDSKLDPYFVTGEIGSGDICYTLNEGSFSYNQFIKDWEGFNGFYLNNKKITNHELIELLKKY